MAVDYAQVTTTRGYFYIPSSALPSLTGAHTIGVWASDDNGNTDPGTYNVELASDYVSGASLGSVMRHGPVGSGVMALYMDSTNYTSAGGVISDTGWHHWALQFSPSTHIKGFFDGAEVITDTTGIPASLTSGGNDMGVGGSAHITDYRGGWDGGVAHFAIWTAVLDTGELAALAAGVSPLMIRPGSLTNYVPFNTTSPVDLISGAALTEVTGNATFTEVANPPIIYPDCPNIAETFPPPLVTPPTSATISPIHYHLRHHNLAA